MTAMQKRLADAASMGSEYADSVKRYLSNIGWLGGKSKSRAKSAAARKNGKRGGRPRGKPIPPPAPTDR